jgi:hypothetical protein
MACGLTGVHQDIGGHFLGTGGDPTSVSMDQNMGNLWKSMEISIKELLELTF